MPMHRGFVNYGSLAVKELPLHRNIGMEIVYVSEGSLRWIVEDRFERVFPGSVFFTLPWQAHGSERVLEPGNHIHFVQFRLDKAYRYPLPRFGFHPSLDVPPAQARAVSRAFTAAPHHTWPASRDLSTFLLTLIRKLDEEAPTMLIQGLFRSLMAELAAVLAGDHPASLHLNATEQRVLSFLEKLEDGCVDDWRLADMASACGMGRSLFATTVQTLTGDTPSVYLRRLRVGRAEKLLRRTDTSMTDIAFLSGFSTSQLFTRTFRQFTHRTPTQYRRESRAGSQREVNDFIERHEWL